ncbi:type II toxin-antitoxin system mRNA interferase toxin, RelE/StbE family [Candidatus Acetothermia bacterium]|jgi:addiction module RelE/StbE family toxin|nr:type II toxin-antitoxin system mRNA interferase toxin, RelE/StbE family [Candidatus Acetothermia bacterium]MCI2435837.1 type II toxin-antitoxin system mRNA interferase toxin, RelE/StbE family [Candidatus Acetothermia bacterium]
MIQYQLEKSAKDDLDKLETAIAQTIKDKLKELEAHPEPHQWLKKLKVYKDVYRLHIGRDWVAVGQLEGSMFRVRRVGHRSKIYKLIER